MDENTGRIFSDLVDRTGGPLHFRLLMQPAVALFLGIRDGVRDAHDNKPAYFWAIFTGPDQRVDLLKAGFSSVIKLFSVAIILDAIYQFIEFRWFYLGEALLVSLFLAFVPYLFIRGPANRIARRSESHRSPRQRAPGNSR